MKIVMGRARTGKSTYIYNEIDKENNKDAGENLILIVPDSMTYEVEYDIITKLNSDGIMNIEVLSFKRLVKKILEDVGVYDYQDINTFGKIMLLKQIFRENTDELKVFKKTTRQEGFLKEFSLLLQELKQNQVDTNFLKGIIGDIDDLFLKNKLSDMELIYSKYNEKAMGIFFDEEDQFDLAISKMWDSDYIKKSRIWIDGFESFSYQRIKMIKSLKEYSKDLTITLNMDSSYIDNLESFDDWEAFKVIYDTFKVIKSTIEDIQVISLDKNHIDSEEIRSIEMNTFSINLEVFSGFTDNIRIHSSMNPYTEVVDTAHKIISLVRDNGYRWKDINIAVTDMDSYITNIKKVFDKFEIPYFLDIKRDITKNSLSKYILSIIDMFMWNFKYEDVFEYLKSGYSPLTMDEVSLLENYVIEYGIEGNKWLREIDDSDKIEEIRNLFIKDFKEEISRFKGLSTVGDITAFLFDYIRLHKVNEKIQDDIGRFKDLNKYEESSEYSQVWNSIIEVFKQILLIGEDTQITPIEYRNILESGFKEAKIGIIPSTIDNVEVGDMDRMAVKRPKALFILGANEGKFHPYRENRLLLDEEREILSKYNIKLSNGASNSYFKDKHMLYKGFSSPIEKLYISYSLGTVDGKSLEPSLYIDILKNIFPTVKEGTDKSIDNQLDYISNYNGTYNILIENIRKSMDGTAIDSVWKSVYMWYKENDPYRFQIINHGLNYENKIPIIEPKVVGQIFHKDIYMTVSKLERYAECGFKYFIENILNPSPRLSQKIELYDLGNINHDVLEDFINKIIDTDKDIDELTREDINQLVEESIEKTLKKASIKISAFDANNRNKYLKNKIERVLKRTAYTLVKQLQSSKFRPKYTELQIGIIDKYDKKIREEIYIDPVEIKSNNYSVKLRGKIDRVDVFEDKDGEIYLSIIDYKSSGSDIDFGEVYQGLQIQLLVYLNALVKQGEKLFGKTPKIGGVFYYQIDDPIIKKQAGDMEKEIFKSLKLKGLVLNDKNLIYSMDTSIEKTSDIIPVGIKKDGELSQSSKVLTDDEFNKFLSFIEVKTLELSNNILSGNFDINPYRKKNGLTPCKYCEYISICQFDQATGNEYRQIRDMKKDEFFSKIGKGEEI